QQMISIVKPSKNTLIIAGAGTGKTTTIVGKIKYLLKKGLYSPEEILVLSFTNASATEMSERINKESGYPIAASTFHKLGLEIIKKVEGKVPKIYSKPVSSFVREQMDSLVRNPVYLNKLCIYALFHRYGIRSESDFSTKEEYQEYLRMNAPVTLNGEHVKSYGEVDIANFLFQNQIRYEYEASYKFDTNDAEYGQYHPDFYLPDYDLYIEYFGINRSGNVADYFGGRDGLTASQTYQEGIDWKRKTHAEMHTSMLECYAYEKFENTLLANLEKKLQEKNVELKPLSSEELWKKISEKNNRIIDGIVELFGTVIALTKSNNYEFNYLEQLAAQHKDSRNNLYILSLIKPIFEAYNDMLTKNNEIDFSDMINKAASYVHDGKYVNPYKYVIVDEYQDISKARFNLLNELRKSSFYELFCVGDDWQSIYRFAGSDINYIVDFEKYWGPTEIGKIETTYRFTNSLIDISSGFIMQNPRQLKKSIRGMSADTGFSLGVISGHTEKLAIQYMLERLDDLPHNSSVFFIGRYSFDADILKENDNLTVWYDNVSSDTIVTYSKRRDLKMKYMTAHRSKGLQADYVFIINNKESKLGFPSKIQDASIMDLLLEKAEVYPFAEERRLFYVALTRAKVKAFLVVADNQESGFAKELMKRYQEQLKKENYTCPKCGGRLVKKKGKYGEFFGCSNYGKNGCGYTRKIK
nr:UvrD-helicase domain-containing protein [Lachnospiraceae bacterium]